MGGNCSRNNDLEKPATTTKRSVLLKKIQRFKPLSVAELNVVLKMPEHEKTKYMIAYNNALAYIKRAEDDSA